MPTRVQWEAHLQAGGCVRLMSADADNAEVAILTFSGAFSGDMYTVSSAIQPDGEDWLRAPKELDIRRIVHSSQFILVPENAAVRLRSRDILARVKTQLDTAQTRIRALDARLNALEARIR